MAKRRRVHYVLSTHWDREWYKPFQEYRWHLARMIDHVIDGFSNGRLKGPFQTDGQAIVIEDYLEVRPERRELVARLARQGKLVLGPWYCMPDEFTVSGESLIRNLQAGREFARSLGAEPSSSGFICDMFGHNSQLPQIFAGFGIKTAFLWRGTNTIERRNLIWRGADGTSIACYRFGSSGYGTYAIDVRGAHKPEHFDGKEIAKRLETYLKLEAEQTDAEPLLLFDGSDHNVWDEAAYKVLLDRQASDRNYEIVHTDLDAYSRELLASANKIKTMVDGELREPGKANHQTEQQWLIPGVLSSRVTLKQQNRQCETLLCHWAEPFATFAADALASDYPQGFLNVAWRWLLQNHPHDSIDGCSADQVHREMEFRFAQSRQIANRLAEQATFELAASVTGELAGNELRVAVFNPLPRDLDRVVELELRIPEAWPKFTEFFGFEPKPSFRIHDAQGNELPYQRLAQKMKIVNTRYKPNGTDVFWTDNVRVALRLTVPAMGYTTLTVKSGRDNFDVARYPERPGLATSERSMANDKLEVQIESNGTLTLTDKQTGQTYSRLLTFEDSADIGDGWYHGPAVNDETFVSTACPADVSLVHDGPLLATFRIRNRMHVPAEFVFAKSMSRSPEMAELIIDNLVSLRPGQDHLDITTTINNIAGDHRLRVLLPSGANTTTYLADSQFDVVERPIALRSDNHLYRELEVEAKPQISWTAVFDQARGLAVVADGLLETAVQDRPERPVALTLFRATRRTIFTEGEPDGQLKTNLTFRYRILPVAADAPRTRLCELGQDLSAGLRVLTMQPADLVLHRQILGQAKLRPASLPATASFLKLEGQAVMTSLRQAGDATEVRLFNPLTSAITVKLDTSLRPAGVAKPSRYRLVDLESRPLGKPVKIKGAISLKLAPKKMATLRLEK